MMKPLRILALFSLVLGFVLLAPTSAMSAPVSTKPAKVTITFLTPDGVPGLTELVTTKGKIAGVATKPIGGTSSTVTLAVPAGGYKVEPRPVMSGGVRYVGVPTSNMIRTVAGSTTTVTVRYTKSAGIQDLVVTNLSSGSLSLSWSMPEGTELVIRRTEGGVAAQSPSEGMVVLPTGSTLTDSAIKPGVQYNYSFWARPGDSAHGVTQANGPVVFTVGIPDPTDPSKPTYLATPGTVFAKVADFSSVVPTGDGVRVTLAAGVSAPAPGAAMVLPISSALRGGYLGVVDSVSADGQTVMLRAGGLGDAFEFYILNVPDLDAVPQTSTTDSPALTGPSLAKSANEAKQAAAKAARAQDASTKQGPSVAAPASVAGPAMAPASSPLSQGVKPECGWGVGVDSVEFKPDLKIGGHSHTSMTKKQLLWTDVPVGFNWDIQAAVTVSGAVKVDVTGTYGCEVKVNPIMKTFTTTPVPMSIYLKPAVEVGVGGLLKVANVGLALTTGFQTDGHLGFEGQQQVNGKIIASATPMTPVLQAGGATVTGKIGATLLFGPGAGTDGAGVIVGIGGEFSPLDMKVQVTLTKDMKGCFTFDAAFKVGLVLSARAWLGPIKFEGTYPIPHLSGSWPYPSSPFVLPSGCNKPAAPPDSVIGPGVTKTEEQVGGSPGQMGYVDGFVPGTKTWVLSTGKISDALGSPSYFASTNLGQPGDSQLTALSGHQTYDAASYTVTVVPSGSKLFVKYAFASEEYPEYVGSSFNDVMAVFVDGVNCALVPGTSDPVSVNTVNASSNASYYIDNQAGASGYGTSYDGLTKPLTCSMAVTPGKAVTVKIAVADASDAAYDSAVALLDQGIWSEQG